MMTVICNLAENPNNFICSQIKPGFPGDDSSSSDETSSASTERDDEMENFMQRRRV